jgi:fatty acid amide hydrolase
MAYGGLKVHDYWQLSADLLAYRAKWSEAFVASGVDALIYPSMPIPALPHGMSQKLTSSCTYMFIANLLLWPSGVVPVTVVGKEEEHYRMEDLPEGQRDLMADLVQQVMKESAGLPLSVSVMTPSFQDEKCLRAMKEVERVVQFKHEPIAYKDA